MIADLLDLFANPRSARFLRGQLSARSIGSTFSRIRTELGARTLHKQVRTQDHVSHVNWSLWIGRFEKTVPWLPTERYKELRYAFALILEHDGFIAVLGSNVGDFGDNVSDDRISYQELLALHSDSTTEVESLSVRTLRAARVGVLRSTQTGRHLEKALSRVGANQTAPFQLALRQGDQAWRIAPGTGRVIVSGGRASIPELCLWFASTCAEIERASEPSDFIRAFAHPVALKDLPIDVKPTAVQLDTSLIDDMIELGTTLQRNDVPLDDDEIEDLRQVVRQLWLVDLERTQEDVDSKTWRLRIDEREVGQLIVRSSKISFSSNVLGEVRFVNEDGTSGSLTQIFNSGSQPLRLTFSDVSYAYSAGQLFRDHRLLESRHALLDVLTDRLLPTTSIEKGLSADRFAAHSLFGFVVDDASSNDDYLVCDDISTEWADFIGVSTARHEITFYHCKGGSTDVGASGLHEVVSQAAKNFGYLTATGAELQVRKAKWEGFWNQTQVPRLQRGASVDDFIAAFSKSVVAPQATRRITLVTSSISRSAVAAAFEELAGGTVWPEASHVLWLLLGFVDQCRSIGAIPDIVCRP